MATIGSASMASPDFPVERVMAALVRLAGVIAVLWGALMFATGVMIPIALMLATQVHDAASSFVYAAPIAAGLGNGLISIIGGVVLFAASKRVARLVTKDS